MQEIDFTPVQVRFVANSPLKITALILFILVGFLILFSML